MIKNAPALALMLALVVPPVPTPYPIPSNENVPSAWSGEALVGSQIDYASYVATRQSTGAVWGYNKAAFTAADTFDRLRGSTVVTFGSVLESLGLAMVPIVSPLVALGVLVALICLAVRPLFTIQVASVRYGLVVALVVLLASAHGLCAPTA